MFQTDKGHSHGPRHADAHHLKHLLSQFDLSALNTWDIQNRATYEFGPQSSRIDFICTRRSHADQMAKAVTQLRDFPLVPMTGAFHIPLMTSIRNDWYPDHRPQQHGWTRQQRLQLHQHCVQQDHVFHCFNAQIHDTINSLGHNTDSDLMALHRTLQQFTGDCFQTESSQLKCNTDAGPSRRFQAHTKQLRLVMYADLKGLFHSWYHVVHRCKARREMSFASKQSRQRRLDQVFQTADRAAKAKDHFQLFQTIRTLAPKQPMKRIMLRSTTGDLLGPDEAADWLQQWYQDIYSDQVDTVDMSPFEWPFSIQEFANSLQTLPTNKALAPGYTPSPFWKYGAEPIAEFLDPMLHDCSRIPSFPEVWGMGSLALLVKPGKTGRHPSELRPIALLEPTGKAAMGLLNTAIQQQIGHTLNHLPQFAYAKGRGTEDAIHRLAHHCREVREALGQFSHPVHSMKTGIVLPPLTGGMTLCLDLTRAFDTVRRSHLYQGMERLGVTTDLISFLQSVYTTTTYEFEHRGTKRTVNTSRGIRQGCKAAPCLWTVFISALMMEFANQTSMSFLLLCITIFADDICSHQMFHSEESFINLLKAFGTLLDLIETANLELNLAKTTVTLRMKGRLAEKLQRRFVLRTKNGAFLKVPRSNGTFTKIKLVKSFKYLGVQLSYYNFERETMALRLRHSEQTSHQLHRWLYTQRMDVQHRTQLWFQCTFSCLRYGIIATGFTEATLLMFYRFCIRQLRRIFRAPVRITRETNSQFLSKHHIVDPLLRLRDICLQTASRTLSRHQNLAADDVLRLTPLPKYDDLLQVIETVYQQILETNSLDQVPNTLTQHECSECHVVFSNLTALRRHCTIDHDNRSGLLRHMFQQPPADTPTCLRCGAWFSTWHRYQYHTKFVCIAELQETEQVEHRLRVTELLQYARAHQVAALRHNAAVLLYFLHHCAICGKFHTTHTGLMRHWNDEHPQSYRDHQPVLQFYCQHVETSNPCQLCSISFAQYHRCIIWRQLSMLLTEKNLTAEYCDVAATAPLVCDTCGKVYTTKHGLAQHVQKFHNAQQVLHDNNWNRFTAKCLFEQAVQTNRCEDLLSDPDILHFISSEWFRLQYAFPQTSGVVQTHETGTPIRMG